ncbi:MAG: decarboxylase [Firmicutes bacterium]|nr:decarboxylase [Bacillota bacterium]MBU4553924.1 decarboxylase [Bacillota bacterium]
MRGLNQKRAPIYEALERHVRRGYTGFHFPGHGGGKEIPLRLRVLSGQLAGYDLTELPGLDDLHAPTGSIRDAEALAAALYGADTSFFLVNGSTAGIQAMMLTGLLPDEKVILPRNLHRSVVAGLVLSGAEPVYLTPPVDPDFGVCLGITEEMLRAEIRKHPDARAVLLVHPNYFGVAGLTSGHAVLVTGAGMTLMADEAHGLHLPFDSQLPLAAMACGADAAVQSMHKMGTGLTQTALLHLKGSRLEPGAVRRSLGLLQSSSPSYLLMASLDLARRQLARQGARIVGRMVDLALELRGGLADAGFPVLDTGPAQDLTKVYVSLRETGWSGPDAARLLRNNHRIQVELADPSGLLFVIGPGSTREGIRRLLRVMALLARRRGRSRRHPVTPLRLPPLPTRALTPREAFVSPATAVPLTRSEGRILAETIALSPPGIPLLIMGEQMNREMIEYILEARAGGMLLTAGDPTVDTVRVVAER